MGFYTSTEKSALTSNKFSFNHRTFLL